jgi:hypothetical protein
MQNELVGHEMAFTSPIASGADQPLPSNVITFPASSAARQNELVGQDTASMTFGPSGSIRADQRVPSYVNTSPAEPVATQNAVEAQETADSASPDASDVGADQLDPS